MSFTRRGRVINEVHASELKSILHSKRACIYYLQRCRILVDGSRVEYVTDAGKDSLYWNIPVATITVLLGAGTPITQAVRHELGKAIAAFQERRRGERGECNRYRHEWVSLRLFLAFVGSNDDDGWLVCIVSEIGCDAAGRIGIGSCLCDGIDTDIERRPFHLFTAQVLPLGFLVDDADGHAADQQGHPGTDVACQGSICSKC